MASNNGNKNGKLGIKHLRVAITAVMEDGSEVESGVVIVRNKVFKTGSKGQWAQVGSFTPVPGGKDYTLQIQSVENGSNPTGKTALKRAAAAKDELNG